VTLKNLKPPHSYTIQGEGKGGTEDEAVRSFSASAKV
jgi:carbon monoxide dehydrogenase subunit G